MRLSVEVEKPSSVVRKLTVKVPAEEVKTRFEKGLMSVQKTAQLKGFRKGQAPLSIIKKFYGEDVRHRVFHDLIDESYQQAIQEKQIRPIAYPKVETPEHQTGKGEHDHALTEGSDLTFTATVEVMPEIKVKGYTGISVEKESVKITDEDVEKVIQQFRENNAELTPVSAEGRKVQKGDFVDTQFAGAVVTPEGLKPRDDMKGSSVIEIGSNTFIPGFEDQMVGLKLAETKTFKIRFPKEYNSKELADQEAEFTVTVNEIKEKKLPELNDEFATQTGHESLADLRTKVKKYLEDNKKEQSEQGVRANLISKILEKNAFEVPSVLIDSQSQLLVKDWQEDLKKQGYPEEMIQQFINESKDTIRTKAESQVRGSLVLESIAREEGIQVSPEDLDKEYAKIAESMKVEVERLKEFYSKNANRRGDVEFRLMQDKTFAFLLEKAKVKNVAATAKA